MKRKVCLGLFLTFITICAFSNKVFANNSEIYVQQELGSVRHEIDTDHYMATGHSKWQFTLDDNNKSFTVDDDEALKNQKVLHPRKSPYTYFGYRMEFKDGTIEIGNSRTLNYDELKEYESEIGKKINLIIIIYGPTSIIKVNYNLINEDGTKELLFSDEKYGKFDTSYPDTFDVKGEQYFFNNIIKDYIVMNNEEDSISFLEEDQEIDIDLRLPKITVKYQDEQGKNLQDAIIRIGKVNDNLAIDVPNIKGYDYTKNIGSNIKFINKDQEIILIYSKKIEGVVNVRYLTEEGKEIAQRVTTTDYVGENYETSPKIIPGYELITTPSNAVGIYSEGVTTVDYIYKEDSVLPDIEGQVIVRYVDERNNEIASRTQLSGLLGETYETVAKEIPGYQLVAEPVESEKNGLFVEGTKELTYQYKSIDSPVEDIEGKIIVNYVDDEGNMIASPTEISDFVGTTYQTSAKIINGYLLKSDSGNTVGTIVEGVQVVTYVYEKQDTGIPDIEGFVNVHFVDNANKTIAEGAMLSGAVGTIYETIAKEIPGYELIQTPANANGVYIEGVQDVFYVYEKEETPKPDIEGYVESKYVDEAGKEIALSEIISGKVGTTYTTKTKDITGYELILEPTNKEGQIAEGTLVVTYVYKKIKTDVLVEGEVITKYVNEEGKEIALQEISSGKIDASYTTKAKLIPGYELVKEPENKNGLYQEGVITVTYIYKVIKDVEATDGKVITKFVDQNGNVIGQEIVTTGKVGSVYQTSQKEISGYKLVKVDGKENGSYTADTQEVVYVYEKTNTPSVIKPIIPTTKVTPSTSTNTVTPLGNVVTSKGTLPKTGEVENSQLSIIGLTLSMGIFMIFYKNYKKGLLD